MSSETLEHHWGRHHRAHVESLNKQIEGTNLDGMSLEDIVIASYNRGDPLPSFNHAAQVHIEMHGTCLIVCLCEKCGPLRMGILDITTDDFVYFDKTPKIFIVFGIS